MKYSVRFFEKDEVTCFAQRTTDTAPLIPRIGEVVNLDPNDWNPYCVEDIHHSYPTDEYEDNLYLIDILVETLEEE